MIVKSNLRGAIGQLAGAGIAVRRESPIYETEPVGYAAQRWFLNMVVEAETELFPMQLLTRTAKIERALGRVRTIPNGPSHHRHRYSVVRKRGGPRTAPRDPASTHARTPLRTRAAGGSGAGAAPSAAAEDSG